SRRIGINVTSVAYVEVELWARRNSFIVTNVASGNKVHRGMGRPHVMENRFVPQPMHYAYGWGAEDATTEYYSL
ncbi:hypothetical protein Tco_1038753, partial [Tanacetum coccineum]